MLIKKENNTVILTVIRGQKIIAELTKFCEDKKIKSAFFWGLGAVSEAELAHYNVETKKYSSTKFQKPMELVNLVGDICVYEKKPIIHAHAVFSDTEMQTFGGHLVEAKISGTCEIFLRILKTPINKSYDNVTGLKIMKAE